MHQPIMDGLEAYLAGQPSPAFVDHLAHCPECRCLAEALAGQSSMVRSLRSTDSVDITPGFYARVMERIEAQRPVSIWDTFLEPLFARRLVYASLALLIVLSGIFITFETQGDTRPDHPELVLSDAHAPQAVNPDQPDRDRVLVQLTTFSNGE